MRLCFTFFLIVGCFVSQTNGGVYLTFTRPADPGPSARMQAAMEARRQINLAMADFNRAYTVALLNHPMEWELKSARLDLAKARARYADAQMSVKQELSKQPEHRRVSIQILTLEEKLRSEKQLDQRADIALQLLDLRSRRSAIESDAFAADSTLSATLTAMQQAMSQLTQVEKMYQWQLTKDDSLLAAKSKLDAARAQLASAGS